MIDEKPVRFKSTGATVLRYKAQFGKDFFKELLKMGSLEKVMQQGKDIDPKDLDSLDLEVFYNISWVMAKTADPSIPDPITWLDGFDEFPMIEVIPELTDLIYSTIQAKKK